jgi:hypothetical protein
MTASTRENRVFMPNTDELINAKWRKSRRSGQSGQCVEVASVHADAK